MTKLLVEMTFLIMYLLKQNVRYVGGYSENLKVIKWFWQFFDSLANDKKFEVFSQRNIIGLTLWIDSSSM